MSEDGLGTEIVKFGARQHPPAYVEFQTACGDQLYTIDVAAFQALRRGTPKIIDNVTVPGGRSENKILLIKYLRGLIPGMGLKEAKNIVEWFQANFPVPVSD